MTGTDAPYCVHRIVQWGDCDPAGIIYTPRAVDFGVEALERWYRDVLGASWASLPSKYGMGSPVVHLDCDYATRLPVDQEVTLSVYVERFGESSIAFRVVCANDGAKEFFQIRIVTCFLDLRERKPARPPEELRGRIEAYIAACVGLGVLPGAARPIDTTPGSCNETINP